MAYTPEIKNTCGPTQFATCTLFEGIVPAISGLQNNAVNTVEEVLSDNYALISSLYNTLDLTGLEANGLDYPLDINSKVTPKAAIVKHGDEIVELKSNLANLLTGFDGNLDISGWDIDFSCLEGDHCGLPITTLKQLLQAMVVYSCEGVIVPITTTTTSTTTTTAAPVDAANPSTTVLTLDSVTTTTANISWTAATDDIGVVGYIITVDSDEVGQADLTFFTSGLNYVVTGLLPGVYQNVTVKAYDAVGNAGPVSNTLRFLTPAV